MIHTNIYSHYVLHTLKKYLMKYAYSLSCPELDENQYQSHVCTINIKLQLAGSWLSLAQRVETACLLLLLAH